MDKKKEEILTDFGYTQVSPAEKTAKVREVFESVAPKYDLMNDLMSFGIHRFWKHLTIFLSRVKPGAKVLDLAGGTGDLCKLLAKKVGENGEVILADINSAMLAVGRARVIDAGLIKNVKFVQADAQDLPFADNSFDLITMAFGLRNVTDKNAALSSMFRVLKPGGKLMVLEFSHPTVPVVSKLYDVFSFSVLPKLGKLIAKDEASYQYLAESIRKHPNQKVLQSMMEQAGFQRCDHQNLSAGIVALHTGYKDE